MGFLKTAYEDERAARLAMEKKIERTDKMVEDNRKKIVDVEMHQNELGSQVIEFKEKYDRLIDLQEANASQPPSKKRKLTRMTHTTSGLSGNQWMMVVNSCHWNLSTNAISRRPIKITLDSRSSTEMISGKLLKKK